MTLIAEDLLLLLLDNVKGTVSSWGSTDVLLGGAVLAELAVAGLVTVDENRSRWRTDKVHPAGEAPADLDPVLADALATIAEKDRAASDLVGRIGKGLEERLATRLAERGVIERKDGKVLGLFPRTTWPTRDSTHEDGVRRAVASALVEGQDPDQRTGALIALLAAVDQAHQAVVPDTGAKKRELNQRAKQIAEGQWAARAVKDAVDAATAATVGAVVASTAATTAATS
ncbi:GPP34 family phosphoprotein [Nocardioides anomalus]|uniref:GPP34 family phosphoprotein n=1 Tax=Nocardioides anomalus TaxID=2712223 RepID=A0A6G6WAG0_9ACTN|nr:GPP34 family phosphoprotein [Nocardioides anomalus]QIG42147.1 GPP34 family phosphoprotein [Nocardioides anomalus]